MSEDTARVGIVGAGTMAVVHADAWRAVGARLSFYAPSGAVEIAERFDGESAESLDALVHGARFVDVCAPTLDHADIVMAALRAGRDVLCEKPLARTKAEATALVTLAERESRLLVPAHVLRYYPQYALAREALMGGAIGVPAVLRFHRAGPAPSRAWFDDDRVSGGVILDQMIHDLDQALWMVGPAASVFASQNRVNDEAGFVVTAHVIITHESGAISHCRGAWDSPAADFRYGFDIAGTRGTLSFDSQKDTGFVLRAPGSPTESRFLPDAGFISDPHVAQVAAFVDAAAGRGATRVNATDGLKAVELAEAAIRSVATAQVVQIQGGSQ